MGVADRIEAGLVLGRVVVVVTLDGRASLVEPVPPVHQVTSNSPTTGGIVVGLIV